MVDRAIAADTVAGAVLKAGAAAIAGVAVLEPATTVDASGEVPVASEGGPAEPAAVSVNTEKNAEKNDAAIERAWLVALASPAVEKAMAALFTKSMAQALSDLGRLARDASSDRAL